MCVDNKGADQPARPCRLIGPLLYTIARLFFDEEASHKLNGEQNDTWNLLVSHRICHFRAIQSFDCFVWLVCSVCFICIIFTLSILTL